MQKLRIGIIGFGTVGAGVADGLVRNGELISRRTGILPEVAKIADLDITTDRGVDLPDDVLTTDMSDVLDSSDIDVVVELIGGVTTAKDVILRALSCGKPVVTANKALLAKHGEEIFAAAEKSNADIYYEASVGGGIPIIKVMREGLVANNFSEVVGILNGTCNFIFTQMEEANAEFEEVLAQAQDAGYAEAEPSLDVDGYDTAHKATILASLAYGEWFGMDPVTIDGIRDVTLQDIKYAGQLGYRIKLLAVIKQAKNNVQLRVHPALVPAESLLGNVKGVYNAVWVSGDVIGDTMYYGQGAGRDATASAVIADIMDVGLNLKTGARGRIPGFQPHSSSGQAAGENQIQTRYYLRLQARNKPGVLAEIAGVLGRYNISIASVTQQESRGETTPVVILSYEAREADVQQALQEIRTLDVVSENPMLIRIEDLG